MAVRARRSPRGAAVDCTCSALHRLLAAPVQSPRCILYIVRRTQLYLDQDLWNTLHARARSQRTTVSELVRVAARERYLGNRDERVKAMQAFVGSRAPAPGAPDTADVVRELRRGNRIDRLTAK